MNSIYNTILCLGDSLTFGARDEFHRGYPAELAKLLNNKDSNQFWVVINEGKNAERSGDLLRRLVKTLHQYPEAYVVLIQIGTNDTLNFVPKEIYKDTVSQIIRTCQVFEPVPGGRKIILGSLISLKGFGLMSYSLQSSVFLEKYNETLRELSKELNVLLVDLVSLSEFRIDKCHLDNSGYKEMAKLFFKEIIKL